MARHRRALRAELPGVPMAIAARPLLEHVLGGVLRRRLAMFLALAFIGGFLLPASSCATCGAPARVLSHRWRWS
jgi:hypothetical protein